MNKFVHQLFLTGLLITLSSCNTPKFRNDPEYLQLKEKQTDGTPRVPASTVHDWPFSTPIIVGHRGACGYRPEHTLESYKMAIEAGADFIEPDLVSTKDGVLIIRHEYEIGGTTNVADIFPDRKRVKTVDGVKTEGWFIEDFTYDEIKKVRAKERLTYRNQNYNGKFPLVTFEEFLQFIQKSEKERKRVIGIYPEIKHSTYFKSLGIQLKCSNGNEPLHNCSLEEKVLETLAKYGYDKPGASPVVIQSFEVSNLQEIRKLMGKNSNYKLLQLLDEPQMQPADWAARGSHLTYGDMTHPEILKMIASYADGVGPWKRMIIGEDPNSKNLQKATTFIEDAHKVNLFVHPYTFRSDHENLAAEYHDDPEKEYFQFFQLGVDGVFSDFAFDAVRARKNYQK